MNRKYFSKQELYEEFVGAWQDKWAAVGRWFFVVSEWGVSVLNFPQGASYAYVKSGDKFKQIGRVTEEGIEIDYDEYLFGRGLYVGEVELPTKLEVLEVVEGKGIVGSRWEKRKVDNGMLGRLGFVKYEEGEEWKKEKRRYKIDLKSYRKFEVRGGEWEQVFELWEKKREELMREFYFRVGIGMAEKYPPRRKLAPSEWKEYVALLGQHVYWMEKMRDVQYEKEIRKMVWGSSGEYDYDEWEGFSFTDFSASIAGPISYLGLFRILMGDLSGALERYASKYTIPTPCL